MTTDQHPEPTLLAGPDPVDRTGADRTETAWPHVGARAPYEEPPPRDSYAAEEDGYNPLRQRERFGGVNWGAGLFGWMVSVFVLVLLAAATAAVVAGLGLGDEVRDGSLRGTPALVAAASLFAVLVVAFYAGGYVAGRMSRFDGGKQGVAVWLVSLLLTGAAVGASLLVGSRYVDLDGVGLPALPLPENLAAVQSVVAGVAAVLSSLLAAVAGGKVGCRYHRKVDDAAYF